MGQDPRHWSLWWLLPILAMGLVVLFGVAFHGAITDGSPRLLVSVFSPSCTDGVHLPTRPDDGPREAAFFKFAAAAQLLFVVQVGVAIAAFVLLWTRTTGWLRWIVVPAALLTARGAMYLPDERYSQTTKALLNAISTCPDAHAVLLNQERVGAFTTVLLGAGLAAHLVPRESTKRDLSQRVDRLSWILYAGTALLVVSIVRLSAVYDWASAAAPPPMQKAYALVAGGVLRMWGVYYTTLLAAVYLPAYLRFRAEADSLMEVEQVADRREWLEDVGLSLSIPDILRRFAAIIAPLIAGEIGKTLDLLG